MHFLDGNDPAKAPGAVTSYPVADVNFVFDEARKAVVNCATGEWFTFRIGDREYRDFSSVLMDSPGGPINIMGFVGRTEKPGFGVTRAYNVTNVVRFDTDGARPVDYPFSNIAKFLNAYPDRSGEHQFTGNVVVIDNRVKDDLSGT